MVSKGLTASRASSSLVVLFHVFGIGSLVDETFPDLVEDDLMGILEGLLQTVGDTVETRSTYGLSFSASLRSLGLQGLRAFSSTGGAGLGLEGQVGLVVRVELLHHSGVLERVLLGLVVSADGSSDSAKFVLNLIAVDDAGEVGAVNDGTLEVVARFALAGSSVGAEEVVEGFESITGEDDEATNLTTGGELEEVKSADGAAVNAGQVAGSLLNVGVLVAIDNEGSSSVSEAGVSVLSLSSSHFLRLANALEVSFGSEGVKSLEESSGGVHVE